MKSYIIGLLLFLAINLNAQEKITSVNFLQAGAVPETINKRGNNISNSGLAFNLINFNEDRFFRMDATWLFRYLVNGSKDSGVFNDTNKVFGMDLPVFTATYGINLKKGDDFSMGIGVNLDSRTFFSSPDKKVKNVIDAFNAGFVLGTKIRLKPWVSYYSLIGYDFMFTDATGQAVNGNQIYLQNNVSFLFLKGKLGVNLQPDLSFKTFDANGFKEAKIVNKNIKLGIAFAIQ